MQLQTDWNNNVTIKWCSLLQVQAHISGSRPRSWDASSMPRCIIKTVYVQKELFLLMCWSERSPQVLLGERIKQKGSTMDVSNRRWHGFFFCFFFLAMIKLEMDKVSREYLHSQESLGQNPIIICRAKKHIFLIREALMCALHAGSCSYMCN